ncbi:hypothetical protein Tco_0859182 [Tanacetum coccineum]|uniref:Uncharacterized protein n=1 Tax=Tanacetum coccineum TaxID=301880 RepID=A0ABQ5BBD9_9ASTR
MLMKYLVSYTKLSSIRRALAPLLWCFTQECRGLANTYPATHTNCYKADNIPATARQEHENAPLGGMLLLYINSSLLTRHNKLGVAAFNLANGYVGLRDALTSESVRFQRNNLIEEESSSSIHLVGAAVAIVGLAAYSVYATRKNSSS